MRNKVCFLADFFAEEVCGGGEKCNESLITLLSNENDVQKIRSINFTIEDLEKYEFFIISNFVFLEEKYKKLLKNKNYVIYEHDHKYLKNRNPGEFRNFKAPENQLVNIDFFKNAKRVIAQSNFHKNIIVKNTNLENVISSGTNFWSDNEIGILQKYQNTTKEELCFILESEMAHKNTLGSVEYCKKNNLKYFKYSNNNYEPFIANISHANKFIFLPKTPETFGRVATECKILGMKIYTNVMLGVSHEPWFSELQGLEVIEHIKKTNVEFLEILGNIINEK